jgi:hypothetical protein
MNALLLNREGFSMPADGWYQIAPVGEFAHAQAGLVQVVDREACEAMVNRFRAEAQAANFAGLLVDFDHFSLDGEKRSEAAGWITELECRPASPEGSATASKNKIVIKDVVVGDVWICSGQSNMDFTPGAYSGPNDPKPYDEKDFNFPLLRQFHLLNEPSMRPETEVKVHRGNGTSEESATWLPCKPTTGNRFTAVGLYFGRKLQMETGVPIGLIKTAWNGTRIEPWISPTPW